MSKIMLQYFSGLAILDYQLGGIGLEIVQYYKKDSCLGKRDNYFGPPIQQEQLFQNNSFPFASDADSVMVRFGSADEPMIPMTL